MTESPFTEIGLRDENNATIIAATRSAADDATEVALRGKNLSFVWMRPRGQKQFGIPEKHKTMVQNLNF